MSYILDALKRADAERERGHVPGLHAQSIDSASGADRRPGLPRWALVAGGGSALVVVAALAWRMGADAHAPLPTPMTAPEPAPAPVVAAAPAVEPAPAPVVEAPPVTATPAPPPVAYVAPPPPAAKPLREAKPPAAPRPTPPAAIAPAPGPAPAPAQTAARPPEPTPNAAVPLMAELPSTLRQQLPHLAVTGSVYSDDAASRFIMLNGEVVKEGGQPAPGLVLERIEPKSAVLRFKGQRFRLPY